MELTYEMSFNSPVGLEKEQTKILTFNRHELCLFNQSTVNKSLLKGTTFIELSLLKNTTGISIFPMEKIHKKYIGEFSLLYMEKQLFSCSHRWV